MIDCPVCGLPVDGLRCPRCAGAATAPAQGELGVTGGLSAPARRERIAALLAKPFPEPSTQWAHNLLKRSAAGERISTVQLELARAAVPSVIVPNLPARAREPGSDFEEDEANETNPAA